MRVVIANPPWPGKGYGNRSNSRWPHKLGAKILVFPVYLGYAASVLKKEGFEVYPIDAVEKEIGIFEFVEQLKKINPEVILMEVSAPSLNYDLETAQLIKQNLPSSWIVFCGTHSSYAHIQMINNYNFIDACIRGEFEYAFRDICIAKSQKKGMKGIEGVTYRENNETRVNPEREQIENLDELPYPDRENFPFLNYNRGYYSGKRPALMITSRGCPYKCTFCVWPQLMYGHKLRKRSAKNVVDEIEYLIKHYNVDEIDFDDDTLTVSREHIRGICEEMIKRNIIVPWDCMGRVDSIDIDTAKLMKKAGCKVIFYGLESGSERILKDVKKGVTKEQIANAINVTRKAGILAAGSFVIGLPEEDKNTIKETIKFAKSLGADYIAFDRAAPYPGTEFYSTLQKEGLLKINSLSELDGSYGAIADTRHLPREELDGAISRAFISYYTSPRVIMRSLFRIRNIGDVRRVMRGLNSVMSRILFWKK